MFVKVDCITRCLTAYKFILMAVKTPVLKEVWPNTFAHIRHFQQWVMSKLPCLKVQRVEKLRQCKETKIAEM